MVDAHVRPARSDDAAAVARVQLATWRTAYAQVIPAAVLDALGEDEVAEQWRSAIVDPPTARHHVLVAYEGDVVVGFAAVGPATVDDLVGPGHESGPAGTDEWDATTLVLSTLLVEPRWGRRGHGSRLLAAATDLARSDGFTQAVTWTLDADQATRSFLESAGWGPDGVGRVLDMNGTEVSEVRLLTALTEPEASPESAD
jgi:GNAT superfamily N-acetyltransferase